MVTEENSEMQTVMPEEDTIEYLETEKKRRCREGQLEDIPAMQGILCLIIVVGVVLLNIRYPDMAEELFGVVKGFTSSERELFKNPIDTVIGLIEELCRR
ncbi:MAG: hypothetical protein IJX61_02280 [Ruminococcus sp.]|nr:hypothetical protein [Ruminococcus sp.]